MITMVNEHFECADDPPRDDCPIKTGELEIEINPSTGSRMCGACLASFGFPLGYPVPGDADYGQY